MNKERRREIARKYGISSRCRLKRAKRFAVIRTWFDDYKLAHPCGELRIACLDFHHLKDKEFKISHLRSMCPSMARLLKEISKCVYVL
jgi:hypothetical protein